MKKNAEYMETIAKSLEIIPVSWNPSYSKVDLRGKIFTLVGDETSGGILKCNDIILCELSALKYRILFTLSHHKNGILLIDLADKIYRDKAPTRRKTSRITTQIKEIRDSIMTNKIFGCELIQDHTDKRSGKCIYRLTYPVFLARA